MPKIRIEIRKQEVFNSRKHIELKDNIRWA